MQVRTLRQVLQGEDLCVAYVNLTEDRATRRRQLLEDKHFACACQRCSQPLAESNDRFLEVRFPTYFFPCIPFLFLLDSILSLSRSLLEEGIRPSAPHSPPDFCQLFCAPTQPQRIHWRETSIACL